MTRLVIGSEVNLEDLRGQLAGRLGLALMVVSVLAIWVNWPQDSFPFFGVAPLAAFFGLGWVVWKLVGAHPALARHLLVWSSTAGLLAAMWLFPAPWLPFLALPLVFVSALLVSGGGLATAGLIAALSAWLVHSQSRIYPLVELLIALAVGVALAWQAVNTLYTALGWAWTMQQQAGHLLEVARDHQSELSNALKSLDIANAILRRTQRELITARRQADEARLMKEQFAANISHELRTPLNLILGFSEMIYLSPEVYGDVNWSPTLRRDVYQIYRSSHHLLEMIDDVLDLSRFEMVGFTLNREATPLESLLRDTVEIARDLFRGRPVRLDTEIAQDLPTLQIDRTRIRQVLLNLLNNAARFTEEGMVRVKAQRRDGEVVVSIHDTGPGIPADELPKLFEEFYQIDRSLHRRHGGTGLGLAISKHFVEAHDGRIWVESERGVGSTFHFSLPLPGQRMPLSHLKESRPLEPQGPENRSPILVVDPDKMVADLIQRHLEAYDVVHLEDAGQLTAGVTLHHPQAVVWNVQPGKQDGPDADAPGGVLPASVPLIECSLPSQGWVAANLAVAACLTKPITAAQLLREIARLENVREVLVIDDDRGFCQLVERMLESSGWPITIRRAYDGEDGLASMRARLPDLVLLDIGLPGMDGFHVLEEMRRDSALAQVAVVLLTATSYAEDVLAQHSGRMVVRRQGGLSPAEVLRCLRVVIGVLEPRYDERVVLGEVSVMHDA